jgi:hypothetical protein
MGAALRVWDMKRALLSGRAVEAYMNGFVLYQVPGEKFCQLRSWAVSENGTGKAPGVPLGYVRSPAVRVV